MENKRIEKVNSLLEREIGQILQREIIFPADVLVTLTRVDSTANLIETKVYISVLPDQKADQVMDILKRNIYDIQQKINRKLNMRPIPKIIFVIDKDASKAGRVEELLNQLKKEEK